MDVLHLGGDEVPKDALMQSPICYYMRKRFPGDKLRLYFMKIVVDIAIELGIKKLQVTAFTMWQQQQ